MEELDKKLKTYFALTNKALSIARAAPVKEKKQAEIVLDMAQRYFDDAKHFEKQNKLLLAYGALNYAHGWLDCGAMLKFYIVEDDQLFTVDK